MTNIVKSFLLILHRWCYKPPEVKYSIIMNMKRLIFSVIASILFSQALFAQVNNFSVSEDGRAYWQKVYSGDLSHDELLSIIVNDGNFVDINDGDVITFRVVRGKLDVEDYGYKRGAVPMYVVNYDVSGFVTVQLKESKYRVTVDNIILVRNLTTRLGKEGEEEPIETWAVKSGELTSGFKKTPSLIYDMYFSNLFQFQKKSYINDEW